MYIYNGLSETLDLDSSLTMICWHVLRQFDIHWASDSHSHCSTGGGVSRTCSTRLCLGAKASYTTYADVFLCMFCVCIVVYTNICHFKSSNIFYMGFRDKPVREWKEYSWRLLVPVWLLCYPGNLLKLFGFPFYVSVKEYTASHRIAGMFYCMNILKALLHSSLKTNHYNQPFHCLSTQILVSLVSKHFVIELFKLFNYWTLNMFFML